MPVDAYWAVACAGLAFCLALALFLNGFYRDKYAWALAGWNRVSAILQEERAKARDVGVELLASAAKSQARNTELAHELGDLRDQLEATRIALNEAQKNDNRDPKSGRFVKG